MERKVIVVIPSYEPPSSFIAYVQNLILNGVYQVVVVNDGSSEKYNGVYDKIKDINGVTLLSYQDNRGKGYALKFAFEHINKEIIKDYVIVTADCDGQHAINDVLNLANASIKNPTSLILGVRDFKDKGVPRRSRFGNLNTRRLFRLLYGLKITDTQTGLRAFSHKLTDKMIEINGNRFEYEMNVLISLFKQNVNFIEIPVKTIYEKKPEDVDKRSHFKTFSDSLKVWSVLLKNVNTYLVAVVISAVIEICLFTIGEYLFFKGFNPAIKTLLSSTYSRIISSIVNYHLNYKFVFNGKEKSAVIRYYVLWGGLLASSYLLTNLFGNVLGLPIVIFKLITDISLAIISYRIQVTWVFKHGNKKLR